MNDALRIVIAEDHPFFRDGLRTALETEKSFRVVAEAGLRLHEENQQAIIDALHAAAGIEK
jgi:DNA-binding NarL/FixJ family response regulator